MPITEYLKTHFHSKIHPKLLYHIVSQDYLARMTHIRRSLDGKGDAEEPSKSEADMVHLGNSTK